MLLVDVKPLRFVQEPDVAAVFSWTGRVCAARGWAYEVWSGGDAVTLSNIRFLAVARRRQFLDDKALAATAVNVAAGMSLEQIVAAGGVPSASRLAMSALAHVWSGKWSIDMSRPLDWSARVAVDEEAQ